MQLPAKLSSLLAVPDAPAWMMFLVALVFILVLAHRALDRRS